MHTDGASGRMRVHTAVGHSPACGLLVSSARARHNFLAPDALPLSEWLSATHWGFPEEGTSAIDRSKVDLDWFAAVWMTMHTSTGFRSTHLAENEVCSQRPDRNLNFLTWSGRKLNDGMALKHPDLSLLHWHCFHKCSPHWHPRFCSSLYCHWQENLKFG